MPKYVFADVFPMQTMHFLCLPPPPHSHFISSHFVSSHFISSHFISSHSVSMHSPAADPLQLLVWPATG
jgi:hypothetical protein